MNNDVLVTLTTNDGVKLQYYTLENNSVVDVVETSLAFTEPSFGYSAQITSYSDTYFAVLHKLGRPLTFMTIKDQQQTSVIIA